MTRFENEMKIVGKEHASERRHVNNTTVNTGPHVRKRILDDRTDFLNRFPDRLQLCDTRLKSHHNYVIVLDVLY